MVVKPIFKFYNYTCCILLVVFFQTNSNSQSLLNQDYLSNDIEKLINSNPEQALKIAQHLLSKTNITNDEKAKVNFLISKAYKYKGDYSSALNFLYEEKNYEEFLSEKEKIIIEIEKISLLRELSLYEQSKKILIKLQNSIKLITDEKLRDFLVIKIAIEKAYFLLKEDQIDNGLNLLLGNKVLLSKIQKSNQEVLLYYNLCLGQLYLDNKNLIKSKIVFKSLINNLNKQNSPDLYLKAEAQLALANICFFNKDYSNVIFLLNDALSNSQKLANVYLQDKIMRQQNVNYLALNDTESYKLSNANFIKIHVQKDGLDQEAINTAFNLISEEFNSKYAEKKNYYLSITYYVLGLFFIIFLVMGSYLLVIIQRKNNLNEIINYIKITRSNLVSNFLEKKPESKKNIILKETEENILNKLKKFENSKRFINKDISLAVLAGQLDSNTKYLSEIINSHYHVNFNTYINKLRINYIIDKLKNDPNFINYKISYLAENCGFASHSSFATVFKSITGISPVKFIELLNDEKESTLLK
jgi:AraC-like DNA-binding protein